MDFNKHNGYLCRYDVNGMQLMEDGSALTPNFWRAPTDNDFGAGLQRKYAAWKNPELKLTSLKHAIENDQAVVRAEYDMKSIGGTLSLTYTINNKGAVKVTQKMAADKSKKVSDMFRFGMQMRMPVNFNEIEYYGRGPGENYADRNHASHVRQISPDSGRTILSLHPPAGNRNKNGYPLVETSEHQWQRTAIRIEMLLSPLLP